MNDGLQYLKPDQTSKKMVDNISHINPSGHNEFLSSDKPISPGTTHSDGACPKSRKREILQKSDNRRVTKRLKRQSTQSPLASPYNPFHMKFTRRSSSHGLTLEFPKRKFSASQPHRKRSKSIRKSPITPCKALSQDRHAQSRPQKAATQIPRQRKLNNYFAHPANTTPQKRTRSTSARVTPQQTPPHTSPQFAIPEHISPSQRASQQCAMSPQRVLSPELIPQPQDVPSHPTTPSQRTPSQGTPSPRTPSQRTPSQRTPSQRIPPRIISSQIPQGVLPTLVKQGKTLCGNTDFKTPMKKGKSAYASKPLCDTDPQLHVNRNGLSATPRKYSSGVHSMGSKWHSSSSSKPVVTTSPLLKNASNCEAPLSHQKGEAELIEPGDKADKMEVDEVDMIDTDMSQNLDSMQRAAAEVAFNCSYIIQAGAGCGKTRTLIHRAALMLRSGIQPHEMLIVTFTRDATRQLKERLVSLMGSEKLVANVMITTFHSLALKITRTYSKLLGFENALVIWAENDQRRVVKEICLDYHEKRNLDRRLKELYVKQHKGDDGPIDYDDNAKAGLPDGWIQCKCPKTGRLYYSNTVLGRTQSEHPRQAVIDGLKKAAESDAKRVVEPKFVEQMLKWLSQATEGKYVDLYGALMDNYRKRKREENAVDFRDMLDMAVEALTKSNSPRFNKKYALVDELQDTNPAQLQLLELLTTHVTAVGDENQTIYGFAGSIQNVFQRFHKDFGTNKTHKVLHVNYRSTRWLTEAAFSVLNQDCDRPDPGLKTKREGQPVKIIGFDERYAGSKLEMRYVAQEILSLRNNEGLDWKDIAVLCRVRAGRKLLAFTQECRRSRIPCDCWSGSKEVKDLLAVAQILYRYDTWSDIAFRRAAKLFKGIGKTSVKYIENLAAERGYGSMEALEEAFEKKFPPLDDNYCLRTAEQRHLKHFWLCILHLKKETAGKWPHEILVTILKRLNYAEEIDKIVIQGQKRKSKEDIKNEENEVRCRKIRNVESILEEAFDLKYQIEKDSSTFNPVYLNEPLPERCLLEMIDMASSTDKYDAMYRQEPARTSTNAVTISTIHQAKGLEWKAVFLVNCVEGIMPVHKRDPIGPGIPASDPRTHYLEERRIAYVGMTRAEDRLYMTYTAKASFNKAMTSFNKGRSRFLNADGLPEPEKLVFMEGGYFPYEVMSAIKSSIDSHFDAKSLGVYRDIAKLICDSYLSTVGEGEAHARSHQTPPQQRQLSNYQETQKLEVAKDFDMLFPLQPNSVNEFFEHQRKFGCQNNKWDLDIRNQVENDFKAQRLENERKVEERKAEKLRQRQKNDERKAEKLRQKQKNDERKAQKLREKREQIASKKLAKERKLQKKRKIEEASQLQKKNFEAYFKK